MDYPTSPDTGLLTRAMKPELSAVLGRMAGVLERIVDFGTHLVIWAGPESAGRSPALTPPLMLLQHVVEAGDAISILMRRSSIDPCAPLLRSQIEATISALYILKEDTERRGLSYRYSLLNENLITLERLDPTTAKGKNAAARLSTDTTGAGGAIRVDSAKIAAEMSRVKVKMNDPIYAEVKTVWEELEAKCNRAPAWHALYKGPLNVAELAERVGCASWYDIFYRDFSREVHSTSAMGSIRKDPATSRALLRPLRYPQLAPRCLGLCGSLLVQFYETMIDRFASDKKQAFLQWYKDDISKDFMELIEVTVRPRD